MMQSPNNQTNHLAARAVQMTQPLTNKEQAETVDYLSRRPQQTFLMSGWIHDNGMESTLNRGKFYGYRNVQGKLEGVALIGHVTLFETQAKAALAAFARLTESCPTSHTLVGEQEEIAQFLHFYNGSGRPAPRLVCRELMFEQQSKQQLDETVPGLCLATPRELDLVVKVHAQMAFDENGVNPLDVDPAGFRQRCARRIRQDRVWVSVEDNKLMFKADIISDLPQITYVEGVYVSPEKRGNGFGGRCIRQLTNALLTRSKSVCLLVREHNSAAHACYKSAGYTMREYYETLFLQQN
jgi:ribosomal protein S18 acetylase RimI-like enzyme